MFLSGRVCALHEGKIECIPGGRGEEGGMEGGRKEGKKE